MSLLLYQLGPQCSSCNQQAVAEVLAQYEFGTSLNLTEDTTVINKPPLNRGELAQLSEVHMYMYMYVYIHVGVK